MGVPKFARFICERYPCILEVLNEYQIPEFDNLYLDMNGIIHCCSHPNDADAHFRITEETIFKNIFHYVEILFRTIKPQKLFFMAVDGVAPRAKINQQRSRRFRSAKEAEVAEAKARAKGDKISDEPRFDSNCITPGTEFMARLTEQLNYFVTYKVSTDKLWQKCKIILSGPQVPGEGEHKIMDYIRYMKAQPDHDPNTRHCLYGLDADLIMLSLCTHEPHFTVLREEVKYGKKQKKISVPENVKFCLLHISLLREYMRHEFEPIKDSLSFPFDLEKIIDDWIVMGFLVGNDFIPHLPNLHIANGALPILYKAYFEILPDLGGYMNEAGILNLERFEKFMEKLSSIDTETFTAHQADLRFFEAKTGKRINDQEKNRQYSTETDQFASPRKTLNKGLEALIKSTDEMLLGHSDEEGDLMNSDSDTEVYNLEFVQHKHDYYKTKFDYDCVDESVMKGQAEVYVTAIQWNLHYYYNGCCSWSWYYPYHYAPFISDIKGFRNMKLSFQLDEPFLPFQQLLAVLPAGSRNLLPEAYQGLLTEEQSPIIDYYPEEFLTDLNEKKQDWEAIVLIPFINEKRLIDAMHPHNSELTADERKRNEHGPMFVITHVEENLGSFKAPAYFPSIESHAKIVTVERNEIEVPQENLVKGLCPGINLSIYFQGFPTLQYIEHTAKLDKCKLKVFEQTSRGENMIITILPKPLTTPLEDLAKEILGKPIFVKWPHLLEAYVYGVSNEKQKITIINSEKRYSVENSKTEELRGQALSQWTSEAAEVVSNYKNRFGIVVGNVDTLIHARPINGYRYIRTSQGLMTLKKQWSTNSVSYAYQTIVQDIEVGAFSLSSVKELEKVFTPKSICFMLGHPHYGAIGEVHDSGMNKKTGRVKVAMVITAEPYFNKLKAEDQDARMHYMHGSIAAQRLGISSYLLSRITGSIFVLPRSSENCERRQHNIGLNLKFTKRNEELPGYTKKSNGQWLYSSKSIGLIRNFMESFPFLFEKLAQSVNNDIFNEDDLFPKEGDGLSRAVAWLSEQPFRNIESRNCDWDGLDPDVIEKIEKTVDQFLDQNDDGEKTLMMQVKSHLLYMPCLSSGNVPPDPSATHFLFDRIISVKESSSVPLGYKGTIINILGPNGDPNNAYDILFDKPFISGISFSGSVTNRRYKLLAAEFINISHGIRAEQGITGVVQSPMKLNWRKPAPPAQNNSQTKTSAFASFNKNGSFYPSFSKDKQFPVQPEQQKQQNQSQDKVMDNKDKKKQRNNVIPSSLPRKSEMESGKIFPQKNPSGAVIGQKTDVQVPPAPVPFTKPQKNQPNGTTEFQMLWNELHKPPVSGIKQKPAFPPMRPPQVSSSALAESPQDPSAFLKAVLKISDDKSSESFQTPVPTPKKPFIFPLMSSAPTSTAPALVQQLFDHARQVNRVENMSYCARMLSHFQLLGVGLPRYFYTSQNNLVRAQIVLPDMRTFYSDLCANHELAAENAATKVFNELNLEHAPNPKKYFTVNMSPPDTWLNIQPPVNVQPITSPRIFPDAPKPIVTSPPNWNPRMPQLPMGFTQIVAPNILPVRPTGAVNNKPDKQTTPFVPLQAQKKSRNRNQKDVKQLSVQNTREAPPVSPQPPPKPQKAKPKENPRDERTIKENDQVKAKDNPAPIQRTHKTQRQRRSRIAANFGSTSAAIGDDVQ